MRVGVRYCGGCKANYNRSAEVERIADICRSLFGGGVGFAEAVQEEQYDILLAVCGCKARCLDLDGYCFERVIHVDEEGFAEQTGELFKKGDSIR